MKKLNKEPNNKFSKLINLFFVGFLWFVTIGKIVYLGSPIIYDFYEKRSFPKAATIALESYDLSNLRCLNSYTWGGYISWKIPEMRIFIDGRTDLYGEKLIQDWIEMVNGGETWREKFDFYDINCVFLEENRPIIELLEDSGWKEIYSNDFSIVLVDQKN
ncbi:MAG: hypothetical protein IH585_06100 [Anaerolineaceae bacterium]|nr:hypothetical protein [Anaerolineaceae bacterium]